MREIVSGHIGFLKISAYIKQAIAVNDMQGNSDWILWETFKKGDKQAFRDIYQQLVPSLMNYGSRITSDLSMVEDSVHDLFVELWNSRETVSQTTSIKFYLFKALRFKIYRNQNLSHASEKVSLEGFMTILKSPSQEDNIIQLEADSSRMQRLKETLEKLPERQREAINLRYFHNFSNEEIALIMGINYNSACKSIYAALKSLKEHLKVAVMLLLTVLSCFYFI